MYLYIYTYTYTYIYIYIYFRGRQILKKLRRLTTIPLLWPRSSWSAYAEVWLLACSLAYSLSSVLWECPDAELHRLTKAWLLLLSDSFDWLGLLLSLFWNAGLHFLGLESSGAPAAYLWRSLGIPWLTRHPQNLPSSIHPNEHCFAGSPAARLEDGHLRGIGRAI